MRLRLRTALAGGVVLVAIAPAGCGNRHGVIADGVRVAGVKVGGMRAAKARALLDRRLGPSSARQLTAREGERRLTLAAPAGVVTPKVGPLVRRALHADDGGHVAVTGPPLGTVSTAALLPLVDSVRQSFDTPVRDARLVPAGDGLRKVPGRAGATVRSGPLGRTIVAELASMRSDGVVEVRTARTDPDVTEDQLAARYRNFIIVDRAGFKLRYFRDLKLVRTYPIAVGQVGLETPAGLYDIQDKQVNPSWSVPNSAWAGDLAGTVVPPGPGDPLKARWLGFSGGAGIHGTDELDSLGTAASHGCIRMSIPDVIDLYDRVEVGTPVYVS